MCVYYFTQEGLREAYLRTFYFSILATSIGS